MKKTTKTARKVLSVFLSILMMLTTLTVAVPGVLAADGNKYYVKVYVNIYDGSDGYGGAYSVEESTGKPKNYSWATNDGWYGRINMTGFTVFGEAGDYDAQDVSAALLEAENLNTHYDMSNLSDNNANGDWDSKAIAKAEYTFVLDSFPVEIFWMNDENNWDGGNTGFAIRKLTVATSEGGTEHTMWEGLAGSDSETYNYYGSITPTGIHTCFEDYAKNYDMNDYKFYKAITSSSQRAWTDPYTYGSAGTYYLNEYANGGVSATFSEGATSVASTVDYIDTSSTDTYYVNYTNHSKTQIAEITGTYNNGNFASSPVGTKLNPGETKSFEINKSKYANLAKYNNAANFTFEYTLSNVYASDELNASLAKFIQPTYIGLWNEANDSPKYITDEDGDGSTGYTLKMSDNYTWGDNSMTMTNTFQVTEGIIERNSATTGSGSNSVTFNYNYYVDVSNVSTWEDTGLRIYVTENEYYRMPFQPKEYPSECGTITLSGNYANTDAASITIADIAFTNVTEDFWYSHSQASGYSTYGYYNQKGTPMWATQGQDAQATFFNNNPGWLRFAGTMIEPSDSSADPAKIVMDKMVYRENQNGQKAYFSGTINVYAVNKAELRKYVRETLLDFAPMSLRYNTTAFENYQNKLASAMNVLANQKTTQLEINNALSELKTAVAALQTTDNLVNQVAELTHVQYVDDIGSEVAASIPERYVLISLGEHTVPQNTAYIGNGTYKDATNKKSNLTTNYAKTDTAIETLKYYYWNIEFVEYDENRSVVDFTIENLETAIDGFDSNIYSDDYYNALEEAKKALEAIDQNDGTNSPSTQEEVETAIINADNLLAHLGNNMRAHQWIEDADGNYVVENNKGTHWYTCSICGYELVYNHSFEYTKLNELQHQATCVTSGTDEGCGYSFTEDHIWVAGKTVASTCTAEGYTNYSCACGATKKDNYQPLKEHADVNPLDHKCDVCGDKLSDCTDGDNDHNCDYCGGKITDCADNDKNHACDICGATMGTHADTDNDHNCDYCGDEMSECADSTEDSDHNCDVCGKLDVTSHNYVNPQLNRPVYDEEKGEWSDGYYTSTCNCGDTSETTIARATYTEYDNAKAALEKLLNDETITATAKQTITDALNTNKIADNYVATADEQKIVDDAAAALKVTLGQLTDENGQLKEEYEKVDFTNYNAAVNAAEALKDVMTDADKAAVEAEKNTVTDAGITEDTSKADGQKTLDDAAAAIAEINAKYAGCANGNHTDADNDGDHSCDTCGKADVTSHNYADATCTAPKTCTECGATDGEALGHDWSEWVLNPAPTKDTEGTYTRTCSYGDATETKSVARENYEVYDEAVERAEDILENENLTDAAKEVITEALNDAKELDQNLPADVVEDGKTVIDNDSAETIKDATDILTGVLDSLYDENGNLKDEYKKPDTSAAEEAVAKAEALEEKIELPDDVKTQIDGLREELNGIIEEIAKDDNATEADYKDELKKVEDAANAILEKYADCEKDGHKFGAEVIATYPVYDEASDTWSQGTYTKTCEVCGYVKTVAYDRANYEAYDKAVADLNSLLADENITAEAKAEINKVLTENAIRYDYMTPDQSIVDAAVAKFVAEYNKLTDENGNLKDEYKKPDYSEWDKAETAYDALTEEELANVKAEIITEAEALKAEIAGKQADDTLTQATATQDDIDEATKRLNEIVAGIKDGSLVKPDYSGAEEAIEDAKKVADSENIPDDTEAEIEAEIAELEKQLNEIKDSNPSSTDEEVNNKIDEIEQAAKDIIDTYGECAKDNHTDVETDGDHNCDFCGKPDVTSHNYVNPQLTRPVYDEEKGEWSDGYYTSTCNCGDTAVTSTIARADYEAYDKAVADLNALLEKGKLTQTAVDMINAALEANDILDNYVATEDEQKIVNDAAAALNVVLGELTDENGQLKEEYEKVDFTNYNAAVNAAEALKNVMTDEDKAAVEAAKKTVTDAGITDETSKAVGQKTLDDAAAAIAAINAKYGDCANGNHTWGEPKLTTEPSEGKQGEYTETCTVCGTTQITKVDLADYNEFKAVVEALENLANTENLTTEAAKAIADALEMAEELDKNLPADATTDGGKLIEGGQDEIDELVEQLQKVVADTNTAIGNGSALLPDYEAWEVAEGTYDALDKTNVKTEIITEAEALKAEIAGKQADDTLTQATATQERINEATARLNEIIAGIEDGSLIKDADFTEADKDLADAKDKAENNNVVDGVKEDIKEIEDALNELRNDPTTNGNDQDEIDELEDQLEEIIAGIEDGSLVKPDYEAWNEAEGRYDALDKTMADENLVAEAEALKAEIAEKEADKTLTQATATQKDIDDATARLNEILAEITGVLNSKPDFNGYDASHDEYEALVEQYGDKIKDSVAEDVADLDTIVEGIRDNENATKGEYQDDIDDAKFDLDAIIAGIKDGSLRDPDYTDVEEKLDIVNGTENLTQDTQEKIDEIEEALEEIRNKEPEANANDQPYIDILEDQLDEIIAGIEDGSALLPDYDAWNEAEDAYDSLDKTYVDEDIIAEAEALKADIADKQADDTLTKATATQKEIDEATKRLNEIIEGINDGTYIKPADFTEVDKDLADAKDKAENNNVVDSVKEDIKEIEDALNDLRDTATAEDQEDINDLEDALEEIIAGIENGSLVKPDYEAWEVAEGAYDALDKTYVDEDIITEAEALKAEIADKQADDTLTKATATQDDIDDATARLNEIIAGIEDGSLKKDADFTEVDKDLTDAKDKANNNDVIDSVKEDIKEIEDKLNELKNDPTTNIEDQPEIDKLEDKLEEIIAGIEDGSLVKPDYSGAEDAIEDANGDFDGGKLSDEDKKAVEELEKKLDDIKNDPTSNKKDDQDDVDSIKDQIQDIVDKYSDCAGGDHKYNSVVTDPTCTKGGYTTHTCTVCGKTYKDNEKPATGHVEITLGAEEPSCSKTGLTEGKKCGVCGEILVAQQEIAKLPHTDADDDGVCDVCGYSGLYDGCACLCHNNHWFWRIVYLIIRIIWKVFNIHPVCACGRIHY